MSEGFLAQVVWFAGNFAPKDWEFCNGQILPINNNESLYSLLGTTYGGDGRTTFALPDLRSRVAIHPGTGISLGVDGGEENVTLSTNEIPSHTHTLKGMNVAATDANIPDPNNRVVANTSGNTSIPNIYSDNTSNLVDMNAGAIGNTGGGQGHENRQPSLVCNYIICVNGVFPPRN
ncbi:microcystin-dependent protein [Xenococcus sp. PCC 7305]|uniref:phage tail protein n=1 Tax=Xenococcus sp. PCC 7305 TaxID=102125 RepID=UPI0002ABF3D4|nr:tail fiber protein [Xenococcus sp. PCC 7305]ELS05339.1 microcystin-dependent protein [Xenococcus sp. PCC 7305]